MKKTKLFTTLKKLKEFDACDDGMQTLLKSLPKGFNETKRINLLHILKSNGLNHFFWAWRATLTKGNKTKRMILHDIIKSVEPIYKKQYPDKNFSVVLKALKTGKNLKDASAVSYIAAASTSAAASAAAYAAYAAAYTSSSAAASAAAYAAAYTAADAASTAAYAADAASTAADTYNKEEMKQIKIIKKYLE